MKSQIQQRVIEAIEEEAVAALTECGRPLEAATLHHMCDTAQEISDTNEALANLVKADRVQVERGGVRALYTVAGNAPDRSSATRGSAKASETAPEPSDTEPAFRCALWSDGGLSIHGHDGALDLSITETHALADYLTRQRAQVDALFGGPS
ncbi:hypothetical protein [Salinisphaera orenii]|uniref:hypothetical protein n=1 Tax=Salinisphaera orenii TaxID=856731 RepID=UPI000DBE620F